MNKYEDIMSRKNDIMLKSVGIDFDRYERGKISFDYEKLMKDVGYSIDEIIKIQREVGVGNTPLLELRNITKLARKVSKTGKAAGIFVKDESCNPSGSFKDRRPRKKYALHLVSLCVRLQDSCQLLYRELKLPLRQLRHFYHLFQTRL